jgi:Leucine-rich repeat (LRR) protein
MRIEKFGNVSDFVEEVDKAVLSSSVDITSENIQELLKLNQPLLANHNNPAVGRCLKSLAEKIKEISVEDTYPELLLKEAETFGFDVNILTLIISQVLKSPQNIADLIPIAHVSSQFQTITKKVKINSLQHFQVSFKELGINSPEEAKTFIQLHHENLFSIDLRGLSWEVDGALLEVIATNCPQIRHFFIKNSQISDTDLRLITSLKELNTLYLKNCQGIKHFPPIEHLVKLERLEIIDCKELTKLPPLNPLVNLRILIIHAPQLTPFPLFDHCDQIETVSIECKKK